MDDEKGFTVNDKRKAFRDEEEQMGPSQKEEDTAGICGEDSAIELLNFSTFIISLTSSILVSLGEVPDPLTNTNNINLPLAKQTINIIEMLKEKTKGNLTEDEDRLIENILYDLRLKYVSAVSRSCV